MQPETKAQAISRQTNVALAKVSPANLEYAVRTLEQRRNAGLRPSSNHAWLYALLRLDAFLQGRPLSSITPEDVAAFMADYSKGRSHSTIKTVSVYTKLMVRDALRLRETKDLPYEYAQVLKIGRPKTNVRGAIIPADAFLAALDNVPHLVARYSQAAVYAVELIRAHLWLLWDSGMRISELLSLRINDVTFDEGTKTAKLQLREELAVSHGLKTGARYVIIRDAVPALKAWLAVHPGRLDGEAPLITALAYFTHVRGLNEDSSNRLIADLFGLIGAKPVGRRKHFSNHDFRHTAATRDARNGYREPALRLKYGWSGTSPMPSHYVHLVEDDARNLVLASPATGAPAPAPARTVPDVAAALASFNAAAAALAAAMGQAQGVTA